MLLKLSYFIDQYLAFGKMYTFLFCFVVDINQDNIGCYNKSIINVSNSSNRILSTHVNTRGKITGCWAYFLFTIDQKARNLSLNRTSIFNTCLLGHYVHLCQSNQSTMHSPIIGLERHSSLLLKSDFKKSLLESNGR